MKTITLPFILIFLFLVDNTSATVRLPAIIGDHMVLQQNTQVKLWGWCEPGEKIKISTGWDTTTYNATGTSNAKWTTVIKTPAAGGPYKITISGGNTIVVNDVLIGEVWLCSGQSNMEMSIYWGMKQYEDEAAKATNKSIRFFHIPKIAADNPQDDTQGNWVVCTPEEMKNFSTAGYFFGKKIQQELNNPVGLILAAWGGTPAEVWAPKEVVTNNDTLKDAAAKLKPANGWPVVAGAAYNAMIYPVSNFNIKGVLWYQGESNTGTASTYQLLFTNMIGSWRKVWQNDFPFYFVQIAPYAYGNKNIGALLREAQTKSAAYANTGMVVISDLVADTNNIHPTDKMNVGLRLANYALAETYNKKGIAFKSPQYKRMEIVKDKITLYFDNAENGLINKGGTIAGFYIAGEDKNFVPATAKIKGATVILFAKEIKQPVAVRFNFSNTATPTVFSKEGLPLNLFRTDDWDVNTSAK